METIRDSWVKRVTLLFLLAVCALGIDGAGATVKHGKKTAAKAAPARMVGAAGLISAAQYELDRGNLAAAADYAAKASSKTPILEDYAQYIREQAESRLQNYDEVTKSAKRVFDHVPVSPFVGAAAALAVTAGLESHDAKAALELVKKFYDRIPQPQADILLAQSLQATGDLPQAAEYFQRVYYGYPTAKEATVAANALVAVKQQLADAYPPPLPSAMILRAQKLFEANNPAAAKIELIAAVPQLGGATRDLARVRLGVADYLAGHDREAFEYLSALKVDDPEADAERLSYLVRCARKSDRHADVKEFLNQLEQQHADSFRRLDALIFVADQARVDNDPGTYLPLYRGCAVTFPKEKQTAWCHWQLALDAYRHDSADACDLLRSQIQQYPDSPDANDAMYFFGRLAERKSQLPVARAAYDELDKRFPNTYYGVVARQRLADPSMQATTPDPVTLSFLDGIAWPAPAQFPSFTPGKLAQTRLERAHLLEVTGLNDFAEGELKFGARTDGEQQNVYAFELAKMASDRGAPDQAMRYIKNFAPGYLYMPLDQAPVQFWRYAFPIPFRSAIEQNSRDESLDPFLVAALIRQESEFNPRVISYANAYGLMQLLPTTGRQLARHFRVRRFSAAQLLTPDRNIQLGTYFFHNLLNSYGGQMEIALASYNAGPSRANMWRSWGPFREPAEFIEAVPFHQTRGYIQIVLRNTDVYKRLYAGTTPDVPAYHPKPAPRTKLKRRSIHHKVSASNPA
ncbi:MAG: transglycosylase SLT domain-containing protein [Acidobacteriaceae bacterium]|nr:transglycosylase SLT domain-containing protein [Acidobacteriaceae bacterium]